MKLSEIKVCVECEEAVEKEVRGCPCCTCTTFFFPVNHIGSLLERRDIDCGRRFLRRKSA